MIIKNLDSVTLNKYITNFNDEIEYTQYHHRLGNFKDFSLSSESYMYPFNRLTHVSFTDKIEKGTIKFDIISVISLASECFDFYLDGLVTKLCDGVCAIDFFDININSVNRLSYCYIHKYKGVPKIFLNDIGEKNYFLLSHEIGHCIHYYLSMQQQHFYAFETSTYVRESLAFMFEALMLSFICNTNVKNKACLIDIYKSNSRFYLERSWKLNSEIPDSYRKHYPLARIIGESLAEKIISKKIGSEIIIKYLCLGGHLKVETLIELAEI